MERLYVARLTSVKALSTFRMRGPISDSRGAKDRAAGGIERREGDGLTGGEFVGISVEPGGETKAFFQLEETDGIRRLGGVAVRGDADNRPGKEASAAREGDDAPARAPAEWAGTALLH